MKNRQKKTLDTPGLSREHTLTFRVTFDHLDQLKRTAKNNGTTVSDVIRQVLPVDGK
jgi:hypothetical protein